MGLVAWLVLTGATGFAHAADVMEMVPIDSVGVISFPNLRQSEARIQQILQQVRPDNPGIPLADFETTLGFSPGTVDLTKPVSLIFFHVEELSEFFGSPGIGDTEMAYPVIAFTPVDSMQFRGTGQADDRVRGRRGIWCTYYYFTRGDVVFVSNRRRPLRALTRLSPKDSIASRLDPELLKLNAKSDVVAHLSMNGFRDRLNPFVMMAGNLVKLGIVARQSADDVARSQAILDWFIEGVRDALDQMDFISLSLSIDGDMVHLRHIHAFDRNRWMARYLETVRRTGDKPWQALPDKPFLALGYYDWLCPVEKTLTSRTIWRLFESESLRKKYTEEQRNKLIGAILACTREIRMTDFLFRNTTDNLMPFEIFSSLTAADAPKLLDLYEFSQANANEIWSDILMGNVGVSGRFHHLTRDGIDIRELNFTEKEMPAHLIQDIHSAYGSNVRLQLAAEAPNHLFYALTEAPDGVRQLVQCLRHGAGIGNNEAVMKARSALPVDANVVVIFDLERIFVASSRFVGHSSLLIGGDRGGEGIGKGIEFGNSKSEDRDEDPVKNGTVASPGPLLGWSCRVNGNKLDCEFALNAVEAARWVTNDINLRKSRVEP